MKKYNILKTKIQKGFTIIEILVIAPIVILVIGVFISAIVGMTGNVLMTRANNSLVFNIQNALNRIENDVKTSGAFLAENNFTPLPPQGRDDNSAIFQNNSTNNSTLILNSYATTNNPDGAMRELLYLDSPYECDDSNVNRNDSVMYNIVYFVKNNQLWRRVIIPYGLKDIPNKCGKLWQQPSCSPEINYSYCKTKDELLVEGLTTTNGFTVNYFTKNSATTPDYIITDTNATLAQRSTAISNTNTALITINASINVAGKNVNQTGSIRATSLNNNSLKTEFTPVPLPTAPINIDILVVAGGGSGGGNIGGGGGGGGVISSNLEIQTNSQYSIVVGNGGAGSISASASGQNSSISGPNITTLTAIGGGGGGYYNRKAAKIGGSGGGGGGNYDSGTVLVGANGITEQGYKGGDSSTQFGNGGGGGADGIGLSANALNGGNGGPGKSSSISGSQKYYGGGGGGSGGYNALSGTGGIGGGGAGMSRGSVLNAESGTPNTGGGGGGHGFTDNKLGGSGGSGIVIIKYLSSSMTAIGGNETYYTDSNNQNLRYLTPYSNGYTIQVFTKSRTFSTIP